MAIITARVPDEKKQAAQQIAAELGLTLSSLVNVRINDFVRTKRVSAQITDDTDPRFYEGPDTIPVNAPAEEVLAYLDAIIAEQENGGKTDKVLKKDGSKN